MFQMDFDRSAHNTTHCVPYHTFEKMFLSLHTTVYLASEYIENDDVQKVVRRTSALLMLYKVEDVWADTIATVPRMTR